MRTTEFTILLLIRCHQGSCQESSLRGQETWYCDGTCRYWALREAHHWTIKSHVPGTPYLEKLLGSVVHALKISIESRLNHKSLANY